MVLGSASVGFAFVKSIFRRLRRLGLGFGLGLGFSASFSSALVLAF